MVSSTSIDWLTDRLTDPLTHMLGHRHLYQVICSLKNQPMRKKLATVTAHGELTVTKMVTASRDWAVTWAVI